MTTSGTDAASSSARWTRDAAYYLQSEALCPRCIAAAPVDGRCPACGAVLDDATVERMREATARAIAALWERQAAVDALATTPAPAAAPALAPSAPPRFPSPTLPPLPAATPSTASQLTLQSVLAVAGAGLIAIASLVFAFLNPDLTDAVARSAIVGGVGVLFLGGAWFLRSRSLRFSAETVGALGLGFVLIAGSSFSALLPDPAATALVSSALLLGIGALGMLTGRRLGMRTWLWGGAVAVVLAPAVAAGALPALGVPAPLAGEFAGLAVAAVALAAHPVLLRAGARLDSPLRADRRTVTALQFAALAVAALSAGVWSLGGIDGWSVLAAAGIALIAVRSARFLAPRVWSGAAGLAGTGAALCLAVWATGAPDLAWLTLILPAAAHLALVGAAALPGMPGLDRPTLVWSSWVTARATLVPAIGVLVNQLLVADVLGQPTATGYPIATVAALMLGAAASVALLQLGSPTTAVERPMAAGLLTLAVVVAVTPFSVTPAVRSALAAAAAAALALVATRWSRLRESAIEVRILPVAGAHALVVFAGVTAWAEDWSLLVVGAGAIVALALVATTAPVAARPVYIVAGFLDGLAVLTRALGLTGLDGTAALCLATTAGILVALGCTLWRRVGTNAWIAVLASAAVPFLLAVGLVLLARTGWTAIPTAASVALCAVVVAERRRSVPLWLRGLAAAVIVPALAVVVVTLGAQLLASSASPVALPVIAVLVAVALPGAGLAADALAARGLAGPAARAVRLAVEWSALVTGALAVLLAVARSAAGAGTAFLVLLVIGCGGAALALSAKNRRGWWIAAAGWTGALWCVWALAGVGAVEPYLAPPAAAAIVVGFVLTARGHRALALFGVGLACLLLPPLALLAVAGQSWRTLALLGCALLLCLLPTITARMRSAERLDALTPVSGAAAIVAAAAGAVQALRYGLGLDATTVPDALVVLPVLAASLPAAALAAVAGVRLARRIPNRLLTAPALLLLVLGPLTASRLDPVPLVLLSALALALLAGMLVTAARGLRGPTVLPPVWLWFAAGWAVAVAAWSVRALRVEAFSLPLGAALLLAGVLGMRADPTPSPARLTAWPAGSRGSWPLLAPGIVVLVLPSVLATGTDPLTARAVLVMALALACILTGALLRLAAPFILGLIVLPVENVLVFAVQLGRSIGTMPWWITLAAAGAVLLVLAVTSERKSSGPRSPLARMRDLR